MAKFILLKNDNSKLFKDMDVIGISDKNDFEPIEGTVLTMVFSEKEIQYYTNKYENK